MKKLAIALSVAVAAAGLSLSQRESVSHAASVVPTPTPTASPTPIDDPNEVIKIDTELVNISVRVVDRNNRPITGLKAKDFKILEDGTAQQIDFFSEADVPTNYGIVVDNSGSLRSQLEKVIEAGKVLIGTNKNGDPATGREADESMIIRFVGRNNIEIIQPFTSNKEDLNDALDQLFIQGGQTAIRDAVYLAVENIDEYERNKRSDDRKRRALILVTDGEDRDSYYNDKQLMDLLRESEVQIFVVGFLDELSKEGGFISKSPRDKAKAFLDSLASETGGKAYYPASPSELPNIAAEISKELRTQYSIGYIPSNDRRDGSYRSIKVQIADGPGGQKRIAITKAGRTAEGGGAKPPAPAPATTPKKN